MAKKGMRRYEDEEESPRNDLPPVPEIQGVAKAGHKKAHPIIENSVDFRQKQTER
ncbi:hypothetical protein [Clostridium cellulovorans]|uniref:Uncharacterized protein n=1 Tax=Clostridium cellulovorans (strain ATCC 35296 / DSM 3052 / OCM 3 / 743B) TaxID=573061 RepID=D9SWT8_CLOC7|nr:hypothetical protein [Clostridium cellulovorans]ADL51299.1 hypothetical protein Clocel_1551 [Clostridium cellulovorans 743B]